MNKTLLIGIAIIALGAGGFFVLSEKKSAEVMEKDEAMMANETMEQKEDGAMMIEEESMTKDDAMMIEEGTMKEDSMMQKSGSFEAYAPEKLALAEKGKVVLFFFAPWCPTCKALTKDINANLNSIPAGVTILNTSYDNETALKKKYGVTYQHTLVQVDADGTLIKKWNGSETLAKLIPEII